MKSALSTLGVAFLAGIAGWGFQQEATAAPTQEEPACAPMSDRMPLEGRASPYDSAMVEVDGGMAKVCYNRPSLRGRTMIGGENVPYGEIWRTGANEPTTLHVNVPVSIAGVTVEPGSYSLYTIPAEGEEWTLIVNASTTHWGHERSYARVTDQDIGRVPVNVESLDETVEQLRFRPMETGNGLVLEWQNTRVMIPIEPR